MNGELPSAIVMVNADLSDSVIESLKRQLFISRVMDGYEFDSIVVDGYSLSVIKSNRQRILVIRSLADDGNRDFADVVGFIKAGLFAVECNKFGPHGLTLPVARLSWKALGFY